MSDQAAGTDRVQAAFQEGRGVGLATGALALSVVAFLNLLGLEKSILAAVLAILALQSVAASRAVIRRGQAALVLAGVHFITVVTVIAVFHDKLLQLVHLLQKLG
ncbi:MAG TPA: hypothetical protein VGG49_05865 [Steroidobacteraceae bacterium]|jgi:hypothetical protein